MCSTYTMDFSCDFYSSVIVTIVLSTIQIEFNITIICNMEHLQWISVGVLHFSYCKTGWDAIQNLNFTGDCEVLDHAVLQLGKKKKRGDFFPLWNKKWREFDQGIFMKWCIFFCGEATKHQQPSPTPTPTLVLQLEICTWVNKWAWIVHHSWNTVMDDLTALFWEQITSSGYNASTFHCLKHLIHIPLL